MPTLIIENKILYGKQFNNPIYKTKKPRHGYVTYGGSIETCIQSAEETIKRMKLIQKFTQLKT